ncbi:GH3 auxin-responsive promoter family protein [Mucilaginibacter rubeus]|uniref:GH3 auxin-responsive promoter family protein n=1 Tax=Mucilaginibacter rubeus TaxID=2027860 RepID=A0AAE6JDV1_9SPHI|nr:MULTISPECIES: GH3 auxin-responsive promoter family protein [Mucilaginibacter]QEM03884.1 GH3 auxin-responsive promoter family protein [Mucilaginibacter rubeus]QEM16494.1 GH3 auxin-responsive promoter family protein [Mucilaginibacter gossypii]QTE40738.1 GH3 auxin-responsive promoter family protein [Mucilaginibacter rubeus]QTE47340.1 GH3 auxin-responsive promoter family protein [Mucilaginibacter rubeus]QTE58733.1 GH3 auxin-responsive promoter family protein [Mucilaginibacter rubeus]
MGFKSALSKVFAAFVNRELNKVRKNAVSFQQKAFTDLVHVAKDTSFGKDHQFEKINNYEDFKRLVPVHDYEDLRPYIDRVVNGEEDVLWPGKPAYLAKTSGTTSGVKYIPISKESMPEHIKAARNALLSYIHETGNSDFVDGKLIFLQGSPILAEKHGISTGRLSGIVAHHVPAYLQKNRLPSYETNCIEDWEQKVDAIVDETFNEDMRLISGIPPWCQMYFDRLSAKAGGKKIKDIFPNFKLYVYGGVNYEPYRARIEESIGFKIDSIETYPASEGFIAFQDSQKEKGLLLLVDSGIFYEFIPSEEYFNENPTRINIKDVELNKNYALIMNTSAGLWGYSIGDTVKFISKDPYRIIVTGRIKHYISAFGEHVIGEEVEHALMSVAKEEDIDVVEFTVAPQVNPSAGQLPYHEWFIEFGTAPDNLQAFAIKVDKALQNKNIYYFDLIEGNILQPLVIQSLQKDAFINYMRAEGKLGGQNKVPRLSNDRKTAEGLKSFIK